MFKPCLLIYLEDSFFNKEQIETIAKNKKIEVLFVNRGDQLTQSVKTYQPFAAVFDLTGVDCEWIFKHVSIIKHANPRFMIAAIVPLDGEDLSSRAEKYGCSKIITRGAFLKWFPTLIENALRGIE